MTKQRHNGKYHKLGFIALVLAMTQLANQGQAARQLQDRPPAAAPASPGSEPAGLVIGADYRIGVGDLIEVRVDKAQELSGTYRVTSNGTFQMYFLGTIVAQNKSPEELSALIADGLRVRYLKSPHVVVELKQRYRPKAFVQGAVKTPGAYELEGRVSLLKLISLCGGLADNHGSSAFIFREAHTGTSSTEPTTTETTGNKTRRSANAEAPPDYEFTPVSIAGLLRGNLSENVVIEPFDIVNIPPADLFFVAGEVRAPGSFPLKAGTTLRQAISLAQGTTMQAATGRAMIFREDPSTGQRIDMKIDIGAVMEGKAKDLAINANDVIIVPNSKLKSVGSALLRSLGAAPYQVIPR
jgi:polysaccharide export outer membrane protein